GDLGRVVDELRCDADRERFDMARSLPAYDGEVLPVDPRLECAVHSLEEIVAVELDVEADQVRSQHALKELALPRGDPKRLRVWPRYVPEERDASVRPLFPNETW